MNKTDLVNAVAEAADISKSDAAKAVDATVDAITGALKGGDSVSLIGFGTFSVKARSARTGRNPRTGETTSGRGEVLDGGVAARPLALHVVEHELIGVRIEP